MSRSIKRFKEGDKIPDGAKFLGTKVEDVPTGRYVWSGPRNFIDYLVFAEYRSEIYDRATYYLYEVEDG